MLNYKPEVGLLIQGAIDELVKMANGNDAPVQMEFNGVTLVAETGDTPEKLYLLWLSEKEKKAEAYSKSPEGKKAVADAKQRQVNLQKEADLLMKELPDLDFNDFAALIDWMERLTDPSDQRGVSFDKMAVIETFREHGFIAGVYTGDDRVIEDRENSAKYLIGQGLSCLAGWGPIHGIFHKFAEEWREKFEACVV